jgi:GNAT superfamily N-acetyltransferase
LFNKDEPVHAFVASLQTPEGEQLVGLVHDLFHRSTTRLNDVCYLQGLIALPLPEHRGQRIAAALIAAVYAAAAQRPDGSSWQRVPRFLAGW